MRLGAEGAADEGPLQGDVAGFGSGRPQELAYIRQRPKAPLQKEKESVKGCLVLSTSSAKLLKTWRRKSQSCCSAVALLIGSPTQSKTAYTGGKCALVRPKSRPGAPCGSAKRR